MKKTAMNMNLILLISAISVVYSFAGRPLSIEDSGVSTKGVFSIEEGIDYIRLENNDRSYALLLVIIYGLSDRIETSIEFPYVYISPYKGNSMSGIADINLTVKTLIIPESKITPSFLLKMKVKLSNGDEEKGLGSVDEDIGFVGVLSKEVGSVTVHFNLGYTFVGKKADETLKNYVIYGVGCEYFLHEKVKIVGELYGESDSHFDLGNFHHHIFNPLLGLNYQLSDKVILDAAFKIGISEEKKQEYGVTLGISVEF